MKKLADYKGDEAIELWADLLEPLTVIFADADIVNLVKGNEPKIKLVTEILRTHKDEATKILTRIDNQPLDGINIVTRLVGVLLELGNNPDLQGFFGLQGQENSAQESSGSATESTQESET